MTAQCPDWFEWRGKRAAVVSGPAVPTGHLQLLHRPADSYSNRSDCYRGYVATWAVRDRQLLLVGVEGEYVLRDEPIAIALTGSIRLGRGKQKMSFWAPEFESNWILDFREGRLVSVAHDGATDFEDTGWPMP